jgi:hypothetical protein
MSGENEGTRGMGEGESSDRGLGVSEFTALVADRGTDKLKDNSL